MNRVMEERISTFKNNVFQVLFIDETATAFVCSFPLLNKNYLRTCVYVYMYIYIFFIL